ncbi:hypothetical protein A9C19_08830 [Bacillus weihaiensis]|uniref:Uncharacterized protein n=1 Tax=Bacillus weihaiensis TaxID=1547283 RepID=A0A1L3MR88_9BACI|nr:hypothetical protein A9C19_08830 [Bacillus weihaiensis]
MNENQKKRLGQNKEPGTLRYNLLYALDKSVRTYSRYDKVPGTSVPASPIHTKEEIIVKLKKAF